jgi:hypothetical protein
MLNDTPGWRPCARVYVVWPMVFLFLATGLRDDHLLRGLTKVLYAASVAIPLHLITYVGAEAGLVPQHMHIDFGEAQGVGFDEGVVESSTYSVNTLFFLIPCCFAAAVSWPRRDAIPVSRTIPILGCVLGACASVLTGRRGLWVMIFLAPLVTYAAAYWTGRMSKTLRPASIGAAMVGGLLALQLLLVLQQAFGLSFAVVGERFESVFDFRTEQGNLERAAQMEVLLAEWQRSPWLGAGLGASAAGCVRSIEQPWAYELSYVALLYQTGVCGIAVYSAAVIWLLWAQTRLIRSDSTLALYALPFLVGQICFLMANAGNPYLAKFDFMWVLFFPLAIVNFWLVNRRPAAAGPFRRPAPALLRKHGARGLAPLTEPSRAVGRR